MIHLTPSVIAVALSQNPCFVERLNNGPHVMTHASKQKMQVDCDRTKEAHNKMRQMYYLSVEPDKTGVRWSNGATGVPSENANLLTLA